MITLIQGTPWGKAALLKKLPFLRLAAEYRALRASHGEPCPDCGWVILYGAMAAGWSDSFPQYPRPNSWLPGSVAVGFDGQVLRAVGGNQQDGAESWEVLP